MSGTAGLTLASELANEVPPFRTAKELLEETQRRDRLVKEVLHAWDYSMQTSKSNFFRGQKLRRLIREALERYDGKPRLKNGKLIGLRTGLTPYPHVQALDSGTEAE